MYCGHIYLKDDTRMYLLVKTPALAETATMTVLSIVSWYELDKHIARHSLNKMKYFSIAMSM